jgi:hypothetical protein
MTNLIAALILLLTGIAVGALFSLVLSLPVMLLWNGCLVGALDGIHSVTWLQAWGISLLCNFLFKTTVTKK